MRKLFIFAIAAFMSLSAVAQTGSAPVPAETAKDTDNNLIKAALKGWHLHLGQDSTSAVPRRCRCRAR